MTITNVFTEVAHAAEFILSEANGQLSREGADVSAGQNLAAGTVVMMGGSGTLVAYTGDEITNGTDDEAVGVLINPVDTTDGVVKKGAYIARNAEVNVNLLTFPAGKQALTVQSLALRNIITR